MKRLILLSALLLSVTPNAVSQEPVGTFGLTECAGCHEEAANAFANGPHGRAMARVSRETLERSCVACHGDAMEHVSDPTTANIRRTPDQKACAGCHAQAGRQLEVHAAGHVRHQIACLDCHASGHGESTPVWMLREEPVTLCGSCHQTERAAAALPYAHREGRVPFACTECHSPHGTRSIGRRSLLGNGGPCLECHGATATPHVYEHPPRGVDGCIACHAPHGSTNPRMLTRRDVATLCIECHANIPPSHDPTRARYRVCTSCHVAIHGSNRDPRLFNE